MSEKENPKKIKPLSSPPKKKKQYLFGLGAEKQNFIENLSVLLSSGMDVSQALQALKEESRSGAMKEVISEIIEEIKAGSALWKALKNSQLMSSHVISLVRIGEQTGRLSENLKAIAIQEQKEAEFRSKVSSAMMYPLFVFGLTLVIGIGIAWFILPRLASVFSQLDIELPIMTRVLIALGNFIESYGVIAIPVFLVITVIVLYLLFVNKKTNAAGQWILFLIPPVKKLIQEVEIARFGYITGTLLKAGLPIVPALESLSKSTTFYIYQDFYSHIKENIEQGHSFASSFKSFKKLNSIIPIPVQQLIISAEQSGNLPGAFLKVGELYENKTEITTKNLTVLLEPILLVIVWLGVVGVALAVILPLYSLLGGLNTGSSTPQPSSSVPVSIAISNTPIPAAKKQIQILDTEVGFLNIRELPNLNGKLIGRVPTGAIMEYIVEQDGWYQVKINSDIEFSQGADEQLKEGWLSAEFAEKIASPAGAIR